VVEAHPHPFNHVELLLLSLAMKHRQNHLSISMSIGC
jgi:hypothetical protein